MSKIMQPALMSAVFGVEQSIAIARCRSSLQPELCCITSNHKICAAQRSKAGVISREGGQGCRDKRRLDRRDKAKYRGSKHKTVSKKAYRVGQEGAKKNKKAAAA